MYAEESACKSSTIPYPTPRSVSDAVWAKQTEIEGISTQAKINRDRIYSVADRLSSYLDRQIWPRPTGVDGNTEKERPMWIIFDINLTLRNQSQALDHIESMLSHLEEIG